MLGTVLQYYCFTDNLSDLSLPIPIFYPFFQILFFSFALFDFVLVHCNSTEFCSGQLDFIEGEVSAAVAFHECGAVLVVWRYGGSKL